MNKASLGAKWECPDCKAENPVPDLDAMLYLEEDNCRECGTVFDFAISDIVPYVQNLIERVERLEQQLRNPMEGLGI